MFAAGRAVVGVEPDQRPQRYPLKRHDSEAAQQMVERAAELARDSHARTRHAAVLVKDGSLLAWGTNGVPFPGITATARPGSSATMTGAGRTPSNGRSRWPARVMAGGSCQDHS
jgi:hypothetical protein